MPNVAPLAPPLPASPDTPEHTPPPAQSGINIAQRLRDTGKTATYLASGTTQKSPTPSALNAVKPQPIRRSSGAQVIPRSMTPPVVNTVQTPSTSAPRRASGPIAVPPGASGRLKALTPPPGTLHNALHASASASSTRQLAQKWHCERCKVPVDKEGVVSGACKLVGGQLYCLRCFKKREASRNLRLAIWATGGVLLAGLVASAIFLTQPLLILLIPIGVLAVLTGVVGGGLDVTTRLAFVAGGLVAMVASCWGTGVVSEHSEARQVQAQLDKQTVQVKELIESQNLAQADARIEALAAQSKDRTGRYISPEQEKKVEALRAQFDAQIRAKYGELTPHENHVLMTLIRAFPDDSDSGASHFHAVHMTESKVSVTVDKSHNAPSEKNVPTGPMGDPTTLQARTLALFLFDSYPFLKEVEIETLGEKSHRISYSRDQMTQLRMGGMSAPAGGHE